MKFIKYILKRFSTWTNTNLIFWYFGLEHYWRDIECRNARLVHKKWYRLCFYRYTYANKKGILSKMNNNIYHVYIYFKSVSRLYIMLFLNYDNVLSTSFLIPTILSCFNYLQNDMVLCLVYQTSRTCFVKQRLAHNVLSILYSLHYIENIQFWKDKQIRINTRSLLRGLYKIMSRCNCFFILTNIIVYDHYLQIYCLVNVELFKTQSELGHNKTYYTLD